MRKQDDLAFDYDRYTRLLAEAVNEEKRLALIRILIEEQAMDKLAAYQSAQRAAEEAMMPLRAVAGARR